MNDPDTADEGRIDPFGAEALGLLRSLTRDPSSQFRTDQLDVIRRLVADRQRVLLVQRTGWGKSAVYFIATRMPRSRRWADAARLSPAGSDAEPDRGGSVYGGAGHDDQ
jgi:hypothetical protein